MLTPQNIIDFSPIPKATAPICDYEKLLYKYNNLKKDAEDCRARYVDKVFEYSAMLNNYKKELGNVENQKNKNLIDAYSEVARENFNLKEEMKKEKNKKISDKVVKELLEMINLQSQIGYLSGGCWRTANKLYSNLSQNEMEYLLKTFLYISPTDNYNILKQFLNGRC